MKYPYVLARDEHAAFTMHAEVKEMLDVVMGSDPDRWVRLLERNAPVETRLYFSPKMITSIHIERPMFDPLRFYLIGYSPEQLKKFDRYLQTHCITFATGLPYLTLVTE